MKNFNYCLRLRKCGEMGTKMDDGYGFYNINSQGELCLEGVNTADERSSYAVLDGCAAIEKNAFKGQPRLKKLYIPASAERIEEGSLSNSGSWAETEKGLISVEIDSKNKKFYSDDYGVFERMPDGLKLILYLGNEKKEDGTTCIRSDILHVGEGAFSGKHIERISFEKSGYAYSFPKHAFFNEELLKEFGVNGELYDFEQYDRFLLRNHYNADRVRMLCERVIQGWKLSPEAEDMLKRHILENLDEALEALALENAVYEIRLMCEAGFFDEENIDHAIDVLNRTESRELMTYLMDYKHSNLKNTDFDFSI